MNYVGVSIRGNDVNLAVLERGSGDVGFGLAIGEYSRQSFPGDPGDPANLLELSQRIRQDLRDWQTGAVVLLETTKYANWTYSHAHVRVLCIAALMLAAAEESIPYEVPKPAAIAAHVLSPKLDALEWSVFGFDKPPKYWTTGARDAYAAAAFAARDR
jgi:hypothetical protein